MDEVISSFIQSKQHGITMQFKGVNSTLHYKCDYTKPISSDKPTRRSRHLSPIILPQIYSNLDTFLHNMEMVSLSREDAINSSILLNGQNDTFKYKNSLVLTALIPIYNLDSTINSLVTDVLSIFNISIKYLLKTATNETLYITKQKKSLMALLKRFIGNAYSLIHQNPDIRYRRITILNTIYINVTIGFSFYTEFVCVSKILFKIIYKYNYTIFSIRHNEVDYIKDILTHFVKYVKHKLLLISDELLFSSPTKVLKNGGIEYQTARSNYYSKTNRNVPPFEIIIPSKFKITRKKSWIKHLLK